MAVTVVMTGIIAAIAGMAGGVLTGIKETLDDAAIGTKIDSLREAVEAQTATIGITNQRLQTISGNLVSASGADIADVVSTGLATAHADLDAIKGVLTTGASTLAIIPDKLLDLGTKLDTVAGRLAQPGANINQSLFGAISGISAELALTKTAVIGRLAPTDGDNIAGKVGLVVGKLTDLLPKLAGDGGVVGDNVTGSINTKLAELKTELENGLEGIDSRIQTVSTAEIAAMTAAFLGLTNATTAVGTKLATTSNLQAVGESVASRLGGPGESLVERLTTVITKLEALPTMNTALGGVRTAAEGMEAALKPGGLSAFDPLNEESVLRSIAIDATTVATRPTTTEVMGQRGMIVKVTEWAAEGGD